MQVEGNKGQSLLIQFNAQFVDFLAVGQQPPHPQGVVVEVAAGVGVGRDVHVVQLHLPVAD